METKTFSADDQIIFRVTGYTKKQIKLRAKELKLSMSEYLRYLAKQDISTKENNKV